MHPSMRMVVSWIEDLEEVGECLEERRGLLCRHCWQILSELVLVIAEAVEDEMP